MSWFVGTAVFLAGFLAAVVIFVLAMRNLMMEAERVEGDFDEVCRRFEEVVESTEGWGRPTDYLDIAGMLDKKGHGLESVRRVRNYSICKAPYASEIIDEFPFVASMMPCSWAIYENSEGEVYVARMNIGLMSKMFSGNTIGRIMGRVGREENEMMEALKKSGD